LRNERTVHVARAQQLTRPRAAVNATSGGTAGDGAESPAQGNAVFERLRQLRKQLADEQRLPPYVIFHDSTLREMALRRPLTRELFAQLPGVGEAKLARYGEQFMAALREASA